MDSTPTPSPAEIQQQLDRVLASPPFANAQRSQKFLRYIVECSLKNQDEFLKEFAIAVDVYGRNVSYDPSINATVRVEAGRLRSRLREYYTGEGRNDSLIIDVPKGGYRVTFEQRFASQIVPPGDSSIAPSAPSIAPSPLPAQASQPRIFWLALVAIIVLAILGLALLVRAPHTDSQASTPKPPLSTSIP